MAGDNEIALQTHTREKERKKEEEEKSLCTYIDRLVERRKRHSVLISLS